MSKISVPLFKIDHKSHLATPELTEEAEWVLEKDLNPFVKIEIDGRFVKIDQGIPYFLFDWKPRKAIIKEARISHNELDLRKIAFSLDDFDPLPNGHSATIHEPVTGYQPWWVPANKMDGFKYLGQAIMQEGADLQDRIYELIGPKIQGNPYGLATHYLIPYYVNRIEVVPTIINYLNVKTWFEIFKEEGLVWHHPFSGNIARVKRKDFGLDWPVKSYKMSSEDICRLSA